MTITCSCLETPNAAANLERNTGYLGSNLQKLIIVYPRIIHISLKCNHALHLSPLCPIVSPVENSATAGNCKIITEWKLMKPCYSWGDHTLINLALFLTEKHAGYENKLHDAYRTSRVVLCE